MKEYMLDKIGYESILKKLEDTKMIGERSLIENKIEKIFDISILYCNKILRRIEKKRGIEYFLIDMEIN